MKRKHVKRPKLPRTLKQKTTYATEAWLKSVHITPRFLSDTSLPTEFLMAQKEAEALLRSFPQHLTKSQSYQLVQFLKRLNSRKYRDLIPIGMAFAVLNIAAKVNRKCFANYRKLQKAQDKPLA